MEYRASSRPRIVAGIAAAAIQLGLVYALLSGLAARMMPGAVPERVVLGVTVTPPQPPPQPKPIPRTKAAAAAAPPVPRADPIPRAAITPQIALAPYAARSRRRSAESCQVH